MALPVRRTTTVPGSKPPGGYGATTTSRPTQASGGFGANGANGGQTTGLRTVTPSQYQPNPSQYQPPKPAASTGGWTPPPGSTPGGNTGQGTIYRPPQGASPTSQWQTQPPKPPTPQQSPGLPPEVANWKPGQPIPPGYTNIGVMGPNYPLPYLTPTQSPQGYPINSFGGGAKSPQRTPAPGQTVTPDATLGWVNGQQVIHTSTTPWNTSWDTTPPASGTVQNPNGNGYGEPQSPYPSETHGSQQQGNPYADAQGINTGNEFDYSVGGPQRDSYLPFTNNAPGGGYEPYQVASGIPGGAPRWVTPIRPGQPGYDPRADRNSPEYQGFDIQPGSLGGGGIVAGGSQLPGGGTAGQIPGIGDLPPGVQPGPNGEPPPGYGYGPGHGAGGRTNYLPLNQGGSLTPPFNWTQNKSAQIPGSNPPGGAKTSATAASSLSNTGQGIDAAYVPDNPGFFVTTVGGDGNVSATGEIGNELGIVTLPNFPGNGSQTPSVEEQLANPYGEGSPNNPNQTPQVPGQWPQQQPWQGMNAGGMQPAWQGPMNPNQIAGAMGIGPGQIRPGNFPIPMRGNPPGPNRPGGGGQPSGGVATGTVFQGGGGQSGGGGFVAGGSQLPGGGVASPIPGSTPPGGPGSRPGNSQGGFGSVAPQPFQPWQGAGGGYTPQGGLAQTHLGAANAQAYTAQQQQIAQNVAQDQAAQQAYQAQQAAQQAALQAQNANRPGGPRPVQYAPVPQSPFGPTMVGNTPVYSMGNVPGGSKQNAMSGNAGEYGGQSEPLIPGSNPPGPKLAANGSNASQVYAPQIAAAAAQKKAAQEAKDRAQARAAAAAKNRTPMRSAAQINQEFAAAETLRRLGIAGGRAQNSAQFKRQTNQK